MNRTRTIAALLVAFLLGWFSASWKSENGHDERRVEDSESVLVSDSATSSTSTDRLDDPADLRVETVSEQAPEVVAKPPEAQRGPVPMPASVRKRGVLGSLWRAGMKIRSDTTLPIQKWDELEREWMTATESVNAAFHRWHGLGRRLAEERNARGIYDEYVSPVVQPAATREGRDEQRRQRALQPWNQTLSEGEFKSIRYYTNKTTGNHMARVIRIAPGDDRELDRLRAIHEDLQRRRNEMAFAYFR
ncbi:MAG: hypothetical protein KDC95_05550 [Planctomycetes bacterium]|nr:hypothetical protein [Planctomycetota bacterium]